MINQSDKSVDLLHDLQAVFARHDIAGYAYAVVFTENENPVMGYGASYPGDTPRKLTQKLKIIISDMKEN